MVGKEVREDTKKILPPPAAEKYREVSNELTISQKKEKVFLAMAALMKGGKEEESLTRFPHPICVERSVVFFHPLGFFGWEM